jgi:beta-N-acetylhexosaminidase
VNALVAGADMVMAIGSRETQEETLEAIAAAIADGRLTMQAVQARLERLDKLAQAHPAGSTPYVTEAEDRALMARAWRRALTTRGAARRPAPGSKLRLVARQDVVSDGVSEAGVPAANIAASLGKLYEVELVTFADPETFDWSALPQDGRFTVLASTSRRRYGPRARESWRPDLHLALWNPYQALDFAAPALMTYGFAPPALEAVNAWLAGEIEAEGTCPVPGFQSA